MIKKLFMLVPVTAFAVICFNLTSCSDGDEKGSDDFDRTALLEHYADDLITPAYNDLVDKVSALILAVNNVSQGATEENVTVARQAWMDAYLSWQHANAFNFGPAGELGLKKALADDIGTFPASVTKIENAITTQSYNFTDANRDARGLVTIEYLLFHDTPAAIAEELSSSKRRQFLQDVTGALNLPVTLVNNAWMGTYRDEFVNNNGTDVGSSVTQLYNEFLKSYEAIKNYKLGIPLGLAVGQTEPLPANVEGYYSGESLLFLKTHYGTLEGIWYGKGLDGEDGLGFKEYLIAVEGGPDLVVDTEAQLAAIRSSLAAIDENTSFSDQINAGGENLIALHTELQKNTRYFKGDMSSRLGLAITFSSGDGD